MSANWKRELIHGAAELFDKGQKVKKQHNNTVDELYRQIRQLKVENDYLGLPEQITQLRGRPDIWLLFDKMNRFQVYGSDCAL